MKKDKQMKAVLNLPSKKVLNLTLKKKWFDMVKSGEKKEEYRKDKEYWNKRLVIPNSHPPVCKEFDEVRFTNDYGSMTLECMGVSKRFGKPEWGGDDRNLQFVIRLGRITAERK